MSLFKNTKICGRIIVGLSEPESELPMVVIFKLWPWYTGRTKIEGLESFKCGKRLRDSDGNEIL